MKTDRRLTPVLISIAVYLAALLACTSALPQAGPPQGEEATVSPPITIQPSTKLGEVVEQSGYSLLSVQIESQATSNFLGTPQAGYKTVAVEIVLSNIAGEKPLTVFYSHANLVDMEGFVYEAKYSDRSDRLDMVDLGVGEKVKGWIEFILPEDAIPAYLKYTIDSDTVLMTGLAEK